MKKLILSTTIICGFALPAMATMETRLVEGCVVYPIPDTNAWQKAANADLGISFKHIPDVHEAYRLYINERWKRDTISLSWIKGEEPPWKTK